MPERQRGSVVDIIRLLKEGSSADRFVATSLDEIFFSDHYSVYAARQYPIIGEAIRIVWRILAIRKGEIDSIMLTQSKDPTENKKFFDAMKITVQRMPGYFDPDPESRKKQADTALERLKQANLQTVVVTEVRQGLTTGIGEFSVYFPKLFGEIVSVQEELKEQRAMGLVRHFFETVPHGPNLATFQTGL